MELPVGVTVGDSCPYKARREGEGEKGGWRKRRRGRRREEEEEGVGKDEGEGGRRRGSRFPHEGFERSLPRGVRSLFCPWAAFPALQRACQA